jgi:hypothetical protein
MKRLHNGETAVDAIVNFELGDERVGVLLTPPCAPAIIEAR